MAAQDWPLFRVILQVPLLRRDIVLDWRLVSQLPLSLVLVSLPDDAADHAADHGSTQPVHEAEPGSEALPSMHRRQLLAWMRAVRGW